MLVEGGPDLPVTEQRVLLVTDTTVDAAGRVVTVGMMDKMMGRHGELVLVNGQHQPIIPTAPGAAQRWRIINGCTSRVLWLRLTDHPLPQIASDGAFLPAPVERDQVVLALASRADVVVRPTRAGRYALVTDPSDRGTGMMGAMMARHATGPITLATMSVAGPAVAAPPLPAILPAPPIPPGPAARHRQLTFAMDMGSMAMSGTDMDSMGMRFTIDGRTFDARRDDQTIRLGSTEDWTITNTSPMDHPFHLHVWPFHMLADSSGTPRTATRQDIVIVPARGWVRLRIPFTDYPGRSVYHCHTADHEDAGMMGTLTVTG